MTFKNIQDKVKDYLHRSDLSTVVGGSAPVVDFINFAQRKIERENNLKNMEARQTATIAANEYRVSEPASMKSVIAFHIVHQDIYYKLAKMATDTILATQSDRDSDLGQPKYFSHHPSTSEILVRPTADQSYTMDIYFYKYTSDLNADSDTNWYTNNAPEVLIFGALIQAEPYLMNDKRLQTWAVMYQNAIDSIRSSQVEEQISPEPFLQAV